ncbi:hypothetical protein PVA45_08495 (plasmid) [Entomospira entomophila]|uniref:Uncharacterized protein n=1 Tax=Entomospira entomophila TaxID=2719988 RepID=A0A968GAI0_9SPIO|nr:hypothetical protein [Entomospira entomophilus]NIZ41502.1 hypothetical protein [Entomospira entomophilus]WDI36414.1 hypothetical protein PVA45_08495 [Entomospira entomophilus]
MLNKELFTAELIDLFAEMQTRAKAGDPMSDVFFATELVKIVDAYVRSATVMVDTFAATTPTGGPVTGTATGSLL